MKLDDPGPPSPELERARAAVRGLPVQEADPAFRARLKGDFVAGRIGRPATLVLAGRDRARAAWLAWAAIPAAAALVVAVAILDRPPPWRLMASEGARAATADGHALGQTAEVERMLHAGARVRVPEGSVLTLASAGRLAIELMPGTEMILPAPPGRWLARSGHARVTGGEVRVTTGPAFRGARLTIETGEARLEATGTTFAVLCLPVGTCVCVYEGRVRVGAKRGAMEGVPAGRRREIFRDGRPPLDDSMLAQEYAPLARLAAQREKLLR